MVSLFVSPKILNLVLGLFVGFFYPKPCLTIALIPHFSPFGIKSPKKGLVKQSVYKIINFRGVEPVFPSVVWSLKIPPRVHLFLWLLSQNKVLTRDNVLKRVNINDKTCLFCSDIESAHHLFFDCVVAKQVWYFISDVVEVDCGDNFESVAKMWLSNKRFCVVNVFTSAALWELWKLRNLLCFKNGQWKNVQSLLRKMLLMIEAWKILCPPLQRRELELRLTKLKFLAKQPERLLN
jgi:hypothetical protein